MRVTPRWKWEKYGILVHDLSKVKNNKKEVINTIVSMIKEFKLPLSVKECPLSDEQRIENLVAKYTNGSQLDHEGVLKDLNELRKASQLLQAFVIVVGKDQYGELATGNTQYPGIYGIGHDAGLVFLRCTLGAAVRHEIGHMFGLVHPTDNNHDSNCVMHYTWSF